MTDYLERRQRIEAIVEAIPEGEEFDWLHALERKFGWSGTMFTMDDIRSRWEDLRGGDEDYTPLTDEQLDAIMSTYYWNKAIPEQLTSHGWEILDMAIDEVVDNHG